MPWSFVLLMLQWYDIISVLDLVFKTFCLCSLFGFLSLFSPNWLNLIWCLVEKICTIDLELFLILWYCVARESEIHIPHLNWISPDVFIIIFSKNIFVIASSSYHTSPYCGTSASWLLIFTPAFVAGCIHSSTSLMFSTTLGLENKFTVDPMSKIIQFFIWSFS